MALSNAECQRRWRERVKARLAAAEDQRARLSDLIEDLERRRAMVAPAAIAHRLRQVVDLAETVPGSDGVR